MTIPLYKGSTLETVGIRDGDNPDAELPADNYYEVFQDSSDSSYKLQEYIFNPETNDFEPEGQCKTCN